MNKTSAHTSTFSIVRLNLLLSMGFGIIMGLVFPLYAQLFAVFPDEGTRQLFCIGCVVAGILVGLISFLISKLTVVRIVGRVAVQMKAVAEGQVAISQRLSVRSNDDVGALVRWYNAIVDRLAGIRDEVARSSRATSAVGGEVADTSSRALGSLGTIGGLAGELEGEVETLSRSVAGCSDRIGSIEETAGSFAGRVAEQQSAVDRESVRVREIMERLASLADGLAAEGRRAEELHETISESEKSFGASETATRHAAERMRELEAKIAVISDVASRINVLSMNASIQAARAGETGKGFAVIAADIRRLANETNQHAEAIGADVSDAVENVATAEEQNVRTRSVVSSEARRIKDVSAYLAEVAQEGSLMSSDGAQVLNAMEQVRRSFEAFAADAQTILAAARGVGGSMESISQAGRNAVASLVKLEEARRGIQEVIVELSDTGARLDDSSAAL
jgi:methyl-accepting chemotaxis protein